MPISGGAGGDIDFSVRITADNRVFIDGVQASRKEVNELARGMKQVGVDAEGATAKADRFLASLREQAATAGKSKDEILAYRASIAGLTGEQKKLADQYIATIRAQREATKQTEDLSVSVFKGSAATEFAKQAIDGLVSAYQNMREQTRAAQQESLRLESVLTATQSAAGRSAAQITELANAMAKATRFDDDAVKSAAAQLATFGDIVGATFDRTIRLAGDMSAVFGGDLTANTMRLAKVLTEPGESLGQLERQFGRFDPEVKRAIANALELNDVMLAQNIILDAVEGRVGGAATNAYRGLERQIEGTKKAYDDLLKAVGGQIFEAKSQEASTFERVLRAVTSAIDDQRNAVEKWKSAVKGFFVGGGPLGMLFQSAGDSESAKAGASLAAPSVASPQGADPNRQRVDSEWQRLLAASESKAERYAKEMEHAILTIRQKGMEGTVEAEKVIAAITAKYAEAPKKIANAAKEGPLQVAHVEAYNKHLNEQEAIYRSILKDLDGVTRQAELHAQSIGMGRTEAQYLRREVELIAREEEKIAKLDPERQAAARAQLDLAIERLRTERDQTIELEYQAKLVEDFNREAAIQGANQASIYDDLSNRVASVAAGITRWRDELRNFVRELVALVAKRWVLSMAAAATGNAALGAQAASLGQNTVTGVAGNWASNAAGSALGWAGDAAASYLGYSAMGGFGELAAGYTAQAAFLAGGAETAAVAGTLAGEIGAAIAAIPVWGWIVAAIAAVAVAIGSRGGGPKVGGSFMGGFDAEGNFIGDVAVAGSDNGRFFTPNQADSVVSKLGRQTAAGYYAMLGRLHGSSAGVQFGLGFDQDPQGTAGARISSSVVIGGQRVFGSQDRGVDKDPEQFNAELALESKRMILAALQASDLPEAVAAIMSTVAAASASSEQIDQVIQLAESFTILSDSLGDFDMDKIIGTAGRSSKEIFADQGKALAELASKSTLTTASLQTLTAATAQYKDMAAQLILGLEQAKRSIDEMFGQTSRNIRLAGLDDQGKYNFYQSEAERLFAQIGTSTSAEEVERLSARINENINAAFALLSPEQQRTMGDEYLKRIDNTNKVIQEKLTKLQTEAAAATKKQLDDIKAVIDKLALDQKAAADTQKQAADTQLVAANTPQRVDVNVNLSGGGAVVNGG